MLVLTLVVLAAGGEPQFKGGFPPTALNKPAAAEPAPSVYSCSTETLRTTHTCVFDGHPAASADPKAQAAANAAFVTQLGSTLCKQRLDKAMLEDGDKAPRLKACQERLKKVAPQCTLDGREGLVDAEGRFAPGAKSCYLAVAEALQRVDLPAAPAAEAKPAPEAP